MNKVLVYWRVVLALILGLLTFVIGLFIGWVDKPDHFSIAGAVMVAFGVVAEYQVHRLPDLRPVIQLSYGPGTEPERKKLFFFNDPSVKRSAHLLIVVGTLVWGLGDEFICWLQNT